MNSQIAIFFIILLVVNFSFASLLFFVGRVKKQKEILFLVLALYLKALLSLGPGIMLFDINLSWTTFFIGPIRVALIPLIYLYIEKLSSEKKFLLKKDLLHFIPTLISIILAIIIIPGQINHIAANPDGNFVDTMRMVWEENPSHNILAITSRIICILQGTIYSILTYRISIQYIHTLKNNVSDISQFDTLWIRWFMVIFIIQSFFEGFGLLGIYRLPILLVLAFVVELFSTFFYTIAAIIQQDLTHLFSNDTTAILKDNPSKDETILNHFITNQYYLDPQISLESASKVLEVSKARITKLIKDEGYDNFYNFINTHRIEESKKLLSAIPENHVIESVISASGFKSRATFYRVFKQHTGMTPTTFLNTRLSEKHK